MYVLKFVNETLSLEQQSITIPVVLPQNQLEGNIPGSEYSVTT